MTARVHLSCVVYSGDTFPRVGVVMHACAVPMVPYQRDRPQPTVVPVRGSTPHLVTCRECRRTSVMRMLRHSQWRTLTERTLRPTPMLTRRQRKCRGDGSGPSWRRVRGSDTCKCPRHVARRAENAARYAAREAEETAAPVSMHRTRAARLDGCACDHPQCKRRQQRADARLLVCGSEDP